MLEGTRDSLGCLWANLKAPGTLKFPWVRLGWARKAFHSLNGALIAHRHCPEATHWLPQRIWNAFRAVKGF